MRSNVFLPGHRIRLEVSSSNFPRFDRNSNPGGVIAWGRESDLAVVVNRVHRGPTYPSRIHFVPAVPVGWNTSWACTAEHAAA